MRQWIFICTLLLLNACTSSPYKPNHQITMTQLEQNTFTANDAAQLPVRFWQADQAHSNLLLLHGFNEHAGAHERVGRYLSSRGVNVWAYDQRGFGAAPMRTRWAGHQRMAQDAQEMLRLIKQQHPNKPLYLLGMSMGGAISILAAQDESLPIEGVVLVAPAVWARVTQPFYQRAALAVARRIVPFWSPSGKSLGRRPSDNQEMLREVWSSPLMIRRSRIDTVAGLVDAMDAAYHSVTRIKHPALLLYGDHDELIPKLPILDLWQRLPKQGKTNYIQYENGWHMLMRDLQGEKVMDDIVEWFK